MTPTRSFVSALVVCALIAAAGVPSSALVTQQAPRRDTPARASAVGTGRITGVVLEGDRSDRPVRRAVVTMTGTGIATSRQEVTDDAGRFVFAGLAAGRFSITAEKPTYVKAYYGSARPGRPPGMPMALAEGQSVDIRVGLLRGAALSGRVIDPGGMPIASAQVQVQRVVFVAGERRLRTPEGGLTHATTDDRGVYRVYGLPAGEYVVRAIGGGGFAPGNAPRIMTATEVAAALRELGGGPALLPGQTPPPVPPGPAVTRVASYHPGELDPARARTVVVGPGDDIAGIDIVSLPAPVVRVEGTAVGPQGQPLSNVAVGLANVSAGALFTSLGGVRADADGRFTATGLSPGRWLLFGRGAPAGTPSDERYPWWTHTEILVSDQDLSGVVLAFLPGAAVTGRLLVEGAEPQPDLSRLWIVLTPLPAIGGTGGTVQPAVPAPDGRFDIEAVPPGRYRVSVPASGVWSLAAATMEGRDVLDVPLDLEPGRDVVLTLTMTDRQTELSGTLFDQLGRPAPEYSVVAFTADRVLWTVSPRRTSGLVRLGSDGRYRITGLPPGEYILSVVTDLDPGLLDDVAILEELARGGVRLTLGDGERKVQDFRIGG